MAITLRSRAVRLTALAVLSGSVVLVPKPSGAERIGVSLAPGAPVSGTLPGAGGYPRVIRLEHSGPHDGTLIETDTDGFLGGHQRFHRSTDGGQSFEALPALEIDGNIHGTDLFELPADAGTLPAGTLLFAAAVNPSGEYPAESGDTEMQIPVYRSDDQGQSWTLLSHCLRTDEGGTTGGLWEPELHVADDGRLVCLYSDETDHPAHSQVLSQVVSADGGATWSDPEVVVATPNPLDRPGMPTTAKLGDGSWVMTYEDCGLRHAPCQVLIRTGDDGLHWGDTTADGTVVTSDRGARFTSAPTVAWTPAGGPNGTVLVIGRILNGANGLAAPGNGATMLASTTGAAGPWRELVAPVATAAAWEALPVNYSSPLLPMADGLVLGFAADLDGDTVVVRWAIVGLTPAPEPPTAPPTTSAPSPPTTGPPPAVPVVAEPSFTG